MIYDCFLFFNELDLLDIRLNELAEVVDRFVLVEATRTFAGNPKPLYYAENAGRFAAFGDRIIHVVVDDLPGGPDPWARERFQRNAVTRGLGDLRDNDLVMLSDLDEIPAARAVKAYRPQDGIHAFEQIFCYYYLNCVAGSWCGTRILAAADFRRFADAHGVRHSYCPALKEGGWHFSYTGGVPGITAKLEAYSHQDLNQERYKDPTYLTRVLASAVDLFGRPTDWEFVPLDGRFPRYVVENKARFAHLIREACFHENWYADDQLLRLAEACARVAGLPGAVMEIGCWEGRSTVALANACYPETLLAVDTWEGSRDESPEHPTVLLARDRDVFAAFCRNVQALTRGNVRPVRRDCHEFLGGFTGPVKFCHIDAAHDYRSVRRTVEALLPRMVRGGILCGDDIQTANAGRADLQGGVERAVRELLPGFEQLHNFWTWQKP